MENSLREEYKQTVDKMMDISKRVEGRLLELEKKEKNWNELSSQMEKNCSEAKTKIKLDVGGKLFATTKSTLLRFENTYFHAMLASGHWKPDEDGT